MDGDAISESGSVTSRHSRASQGSAGVNSQKSAPNVTAIAANNDVYLPSCKEATGVIEIMSVDDEPTNQVVVAAMLKKRNYRLVKAMDGQEALDILHERQAHGMYMPDLILLDVMMPKKNGWVVFLRGNHATLPYYNEYRLKHSLSL